ncbi:MAG: hypothetical protein GXP14_05145 [Gammaproteobacteria bacterium]|nr:hypothetical protein [Gammaproteobacteria bacterium]
MKYRADLINKQIFAEGNIQVSPQEVIHLNLQPPSLFKPSFEQKVINNGYRIFLSGYADKIFKKERAHHTFINLQRAIVSLRGNPRPTFGGYLKKGTTDTRTLASNYHHIFYNIINGQILVFNIVVKDNIRLQRDKLEKIGLYKVKKIGASRWETKKINLVTTPYAAVNGQSNNLNKAIWLMGAHLEFEFGENTIHEYTLFHNPSVGGPGDTWESIQDKFGITTDVSKKLSDILVKTQENKHQTQWVVHSQGGLIFAEAVRYHLNGNSSWAITGGFNGIFRKDKGESLNMHSVAFHGNANNNLRSSVLFKRAGVDVIATKANDYDMVNTIIGLNTINPWRVIGSVVYSNHAMGGTVQQSPHSLMHDNFDAWDQQMRHGPGKGRNTLQKGFNVIDQAGRGGIKYINNFLK